jgi:hypothetical protein
MTTSLSNTQNECPLVHNKVQWQTLLNTVMNFGDSYMAQNLTTWATIRFSKKDKLNS